MRFVRFSWVILLVAGQLAWGEELERLGPVKFEGQVAKANDISALGIVGEFLVLGTDEGNRIQLLQRNGDDYDLMRDFALNDSGKEIDIEGIANEKNTVYVVGSHSWKRKPVQDDAPYATNRESFEQVFSPVDDHDSRDSLYRFELNAEGKPERVQHTTLRPVLEKYGVLKMFSGLPSKENGVDIEGIAVQDGKLYVGFRGPVLRENYVPVVTFEFADPVGTSDLLYVRLDGRGIRDLAPVKRGFLILAGPVGDGSGSYQLYFWDGRDCLPGIRAAGQMGKIKLLSEIPAKKNAKAEGITVLKENASAYEFMIVYDDMKEGDATRFRLSKN